MPRITHHSATVTAPADDPALQVALAGPSAGWIMEARAQAQGDDLPLAALDAAALASWLKRAACASLARDIQARADECACAYRSPT